MADTEELRLVVSLTDNASAQLTSIRGQIQNTFGPTAHTQLDQFGRKSDEIYRKLKDLAEATTGVGKAFDFFTRGFGAAGIAIAGVGYAIASQLRSLKEYADHMTRLGNAASGLGLSAGSVRNVEEAFQRVGRSAGDALKVMEDIQRVQEDLLRRGGGEIANRLLAHAQTPESLRAMNQFLAQLREAHTIEQQIEIIREAAENVYRNNLQYGEQRARQLEKEFLQTLGVSDAVMDLHGKIRELTAEEVKQQQAMVEQAKLYNEQVTYIEQGWDRIIRYFENNAVTNLYNAFKGMAEYAEKIGNWFEKIRPGATGQSLDDAVKNFHLLPRPETEGRGDPSIYGQPQFFSGGGGQPFWQNWRRSTNIEDHRTGRGGGDLMEENNRQLKMLNDSLFEMLHPAGAAGGGGGGLGLIGGGGAGGGGGGGPGSIPPMGNLGGGGGGISTGGGAPYGSHVGAGTGAGAGETSPHGTVSGDTFDRLTNYFAAGGGTAGGHGLAGDRARYARELERNPALRQKIMRIAFNEQGANPQGTQAVLESMMNRASARGTNLETQAHWYGGEKGGYYAMGNMGRGALENPHSRAILEHSLNEALGGSNISNYATDNSSGGLAARERATGKFHYTAGYHGESFFTPGWGEPGLERKYNAWRQALGASEDRMALDAHSVRTHKVEASGKLTANINAPKGTDVTLEGGGAFTKIEMNRQTQMEPARSGPAIGQ